MRKFTLAALLLTIGLLVFSLTAVSAQDNQRNPLAVTTSKFEAHINPDNHQLVITTKSNAIFAPPPYDTDPIEVIGTLNNIGVLFEHYALAYSVTDTGYTVQDIPIEEKWTDFTVASYVRKTDTTVCLLRSAAIPPGNVVTSATWHIEYSLFGFDNGAHLLESVACMSDIAASMTQTELATMANTLTDSLKNTGAGTNSRLEQPASKDGKTYFTLDKGELHAFGTDLVISDHPEYATRYGKKDKCGAPIAGIMQEYARFGGIAYENCIVEVTNIVAIDPIKKNPGFDLPAYAGDDNFRQDLHIFSSRQTVNNLAWLLGWQTSNVGAASFDFSVIAYQLHYGDNLTFAPNSEAWANYQINSDEIVEIQTAFSSNIKAA